MPTVREATFELFRAHRMTTIFGNPGSTELPMLAELPEDGTRSGGPSRAQRPPIRRRSRRRCVRTSP